RVSYRSALLGLNADRCAVPVGASPVAAACRALTTGAVVLVGGLTDRTLRSAAGPRGRGYAARVSCPPSRGSSAADRKPPAHRQWWKQWLPRRPPESAPAPLNG